MLNELYLRAFTIGGNFDEEYLSNIPAIKQLRQFAFRRPVTFFVGENGSGKSTLLEALAIQCGSIPRAEPVISTLLQNRKIKGMESVAKCALQIRHITYLEKQPDFSKWEVNPEVWFVEE